MVSYASVNNSAADVKQRPGVRVSEQKEAFFRPLRARRTLMHSSQTKAANPSSGETRKDLSDSIFDSVAFHFRNAPKAGASGAAA